MTDDNPRPYRIRATKGFGMVWAIGCPICKKPVPLGIDENAAVRLLDAGPIFHPECKNIPSARTPELEGLEL